MHSVDDEEGYAPFDGSNHCGRTGCACPHVYCDKGFDYAFPRKVTNPDGRVVEYEQVRPCSVCKSEAYDALQRSRSRPDFFRRLRSLRPAKP